MKITGVIGKGIKKITSHRDLKSELGKLLQLNLRTMWLLLKKSDSDEEIDCSVCRDANYALYVKKDIDSYSRIKLTGKELIQYISDNATKESSFYWYMLKDESWIQGV